MDRTRWSAGLLGVALAVGLMGPAAADPPEHTPGGPCLEPSQEVRLRSVPSYDQVVERLASIEQSSQGTVQVRSAGRSGEGRELLYATVGEGPDGSDPGFKTQGAIFYEVRSVGQKSNGMLEELFVRPTMAVLAAAADGSLGSSPDTGWEDIPFGDGVPCGGGPEDAP